MDWLWIPAVAVLTVFIFVLCWLFFSSYTCCPCRRKSTGDSILPTHVGSEASPFTGPRAYPPSAPQHYPGTPSESPTLHLKYADVPKSSSSSNPEVVLPTPIPSISASLPETTASTPKLSSEHASIPSSQKVSVPSLDVSTLTTTTITITPSIDVSRQSLDTVDTRIQDISVKPSFDRGHPSPILSGSSIRRKSLRSTKRLSTKRTVPFPYNRTAWGSIRLHYRYGDFSLRKVFRKEGSIQAVDLHRMTVNEAKILVNEFLEECETEGIHDRVKIITGRGVHSYGGIPRLKPAVQSILDKRNLQFSEQNGGGCFEVYL